MKLAALSYALIIAIKKKEEKIEMLKTRLPSHSGKSRPRYRKSCRIRSGKRHKKLPQVHKGSTCGFSLEGVPASCLTGESMKSCLSVLYGYTKPAS